MVKMICFNNGIVRVFTCLFLLYLNPNSTILCDEAKELKSTPNICVVPTLSPHTNSTYKCIGNIKNQSKSCVSNGTVFESTVIKITCDAGYSVNGEDTSVSVCYDNEWVPPVKGCIANCGQLPKNSDDPQTSGLPWNVAILRSDTGNICFGTIISSRVILTSEFCMLTSVFAIPDYASMSRNPLDPTIFKVVIVNDEFNPFNKNKHSTPLMIKEFRYFKHGNQDKSLLHDVLIVIMEKGINFNSHVYPACVEWKNPKRLNITTGIAKVQQFISYKGGYRNKNYSFLSHDACQENPAYPYLVFIWANLMYGYDKTNEARYDTKIFRKSDENALHEGKLFCLELKQNELNGSLTISGSGVVVEKDYRYYIRGIAGKSLVRNQSHDDARFKDFINIFRIIANTSSFEHFSNYPKFVDQADFLLDYNFTSLLRNHLKRGEAELANHLEQLIPVTDIADYVDWIKHVVAEVDPYFNTST
ncbi:uncharacterized protein LOC135843992 [Planococcus citri]|uniref:uncharacterized protein LOC135843992 n=1 Tax=Planococcus citri TaxID=170843 RepID=UPI0031F99548